MKKRFRKENSFSFFFIEAVVWHASLAVLSFPGFVLPVICAPFSDRFIKAVNQLLLTMKKVLIVNDLHCGSICGLGVPAFVGSANYRLPFTETNQFLYDKWMEMVRDVGQVDLVIANGDLVEGLNKKKNGEEIITPYITDQCSMAVELLKRINSKNYAFTGGSPYHTGQDINGDQEVCARIGGTWFGPDGKIELEGIKIHVRHVNSYSKVPYARATSLLFEQCIAAIEGDSTDIFIRSHTHKFVYAGINGRLSMTTPCWKASDTYIRHKSIEKTDCGWILITIDGFNYSWQHHVFSAPDTTPVLKI